MANKIHFQATLSGKTVCATRSIGKGKLRNNGRNTYATIPVECVVQAEAFRATPDADRCAHCAEKFTEVLNRRRKLSGKLLYANGFTKELV